MSAPSYFIRPIQPHDDAAVASIVRSVLASYGGVGPGFASSDPEVDCMCRAYDREGALYFVIERLSAEPGAVPVVVGGGGIAPLEGSDPAERICELRKMYFLPDARGQGLGKELLSRCLWAARAYGYRRCYLESMHGMTQAVALYESFGFARLPAALGTTGHHGCQRYYVRDLDDLSALPDPTVKSAEVTLADIQAAAQRIAGAVRRTPTLKLLALREPIAGLSSLWLKLELLQVTGSFKARGAISKLRSLPESAIAAGIVTASSGNHGLAIAYAGQVAGVPATVFLPTVVPEAKVDKLRRFGARIERVGTVFDDSNDAALAFAARHGVTYIHPFADRLVIAGQGTLGLELLEDVPDLDTLLISIGGGGLIAGVAVAAKALRPGIKIIGIEPQGAPTLKESLKADALIRLAEINTLAGTLAPRKTAAINLAHVRRYVDDIVLVSDDEMRAAARWLWFEAAVAAELSGAAALAALHCGRYRPSPGERVGVVVCGAGTDGIPLS